MLGRDFNIDHKVGSEFDGVIHGFTSTFSKSKCRADARSADSGVQFDASA
jgi:hypothetical protein